MNLERDDFLRHLKGKLLDKREEAIDLPLAREKIFGDFLPGLKLRMSLTGAKK
jgi:hypothetical protein